MAASVKQYAMKKYWTKGKMCLVLMRATNGNYLTCGSVLVPVKNCKEVIDKDLFTAKNVSDEIIKAKMEVYYPGISEYRIMDNAEKCDTILRVKDERHTALKGPFLMACDTDKGAAIYMRMFVNEHTGSVYWIDESYVQFFELSTIQAGSSSIEITYGGEYCVGIMPMKNLVKEECRGIKELADFCKLGQGTANEIAARELIKERKVKK